MKIGHVTFGKDDFGYGISYILHKNGIKSKRATIRSAKEFDILLFSIFWWEHVYDFVNFCVRAGVGYKSKKPQVIVGGFNTFNPLVFLPWAHKIVVGDGEDVVMSAIKDEPHPSIYTGSEKTVKYNQCQIKTNDFVYRNKDMSRIEIARGCKYKCTYCQLTFLKKYREVNYTTIKDAIDRVETKSVALFAPNGMSHKHYTQISEYAKEKGLNNMATDSRYDSLHLFASNNTPTVGIEGISERLRKSVKKPLSNKKFMTLIEERMARCIERGYKPTIHTYFILDLPGENESDWEDLENLLMMCNDIKGIEDFTWLITGNVFMPPPHTPLEGTAINHERDYRKRWRHALADRWRKKKFKYTLTNRHTIFSPYSRLLSMIATRGGREASEIIFNIVSNKELKGHTVGRWGKKLNALTNFINRNYGSVDRYTGELKEMPWKVVKL